MPCLVEDAMSEAQVVCLRLQTPTLMLQGSTSNSTALLQNLTVSQRPTLPCLLTQGQHRWGYQVKAGGINSVHTWGGYFGWKG
jgi:hypothetical protein